MGPCFLFSNSLPEQLLYMDFYFNSGPSKPRQNLAENVLTGTPGSWLKRSSRDSVYTERAFNGRKEGGDPYSLYSIADGGQRSHWAVTVWVRLCLNKWKKEWPSLWSSFDSIRSSSQRFRGATLQDFKFDVWLEKSKQQATIFTQFILSFFTTSFNSFFDFQYETIICPKYQPSRKQIIKPEMFLFNWEKTWSPIATLYSYIFLLLPLPPKQTLSKRIKFFNTKQVKK